jgi:simple sugar transport system permease protein
MQRSNLLSAWIALGLILVFDFFFTPGFFHLEIKNGHLYGSLVDIVFRAAPIMILGVGMTLVIATRGIDISVGSVAAIAGAVAAVLTAKAGAPLWVAITVPLVLTLVLGAWNGIMVAFFGIQPIVATLILMVSGRGIAQLVTDGKIVTFLDPGLEFFGGGFVLGLPFVLTLVAFLVLAAWALTRRTALGLFIESVGINARASTVAGLPAQLVVFSVFVVSGFCAGLAGLFYASEIKGADANNAGLYTELDAILAVVIGGTSMDGGKFFLGGTLLGALVMQALTTTILTFGVPVEATLVLKAGVVLALCLLQSPDFRRGLIPYLTRTRKAS